MADTAVTSGSDATAAADAAAQRAAEQARLRKERREAKIKAGGSARLNKITGAGGRVVGDSDPAPVAAPQPAATSPPNPFAVSSSSGAVDDPEEVVLAEHHYVPQTTARRTAPSAAAAAAAAIPSAPGPSLSEAQLRQMMLGLDRPPQLSPQQDAAAAAEDPLMKMMSQMMAGAGAGAGGASPFPGMSMPMPPMPAQQAPVPAPTSSATIWRLLHALFAIGLGVFFALTTPFTGSKIERERAAMASFSTAGLQGQGQGQQPEDEEQRRRILFFWAFATAEVALLSSRFLFDKASTRSTGMVGTVLSYLPQPYRGYLEIGQRYLQILSAVRADLLTCVFVLGLYIYFQPESGHA
ncbi:Sad1-interacting factor 1 [Escovopsis weberi]|uniref:Sad1-interacting factor 1 n=1 Tax=Escovopsis weberi TaxID=150374 RepID=A0A0M9VV59_ESCWE|nr:Sad1-interacting factor 1 [Escovopsis weberi]